MMRWPVQLVGRLKVRRYQENMEYCMTPESADSIGNGTRMTPDRFCPAGTGSLVAPAWNCQTPFKLSQLVRTICGRGYSARTLAGFTCCAQSVINGACFGCHGNEAGAAVMTKSSDLFGTFVTNCAAIPEGIEPSVKFPLPVFELYCTSGNWPVEKLNPAMLTVTGPLTKSEFTWSGAVGCPPSPAKLKLNPLPAAASDNVGTESCALAEARVTPKAAPPATAQVVEAKVAGAVAISVPLLTKVAPE